jgi:uncharacterized protein (TIGR00299 family) protein
MMLGALVDAGADPERIRAAIESLGIPIRIEFCRQKRAGVSGTAVRITAEDQKKHRHLPEIEKRIRQSSLSEGQQERAITIFRRLGEAEAAVHGVPLEKVHFHEVGAWDSVADIVGTAVGLDLIGVERWTCRPVPLGSGLISCDHGTMPVPAPATALLLRGAPTAAVPVSGELTTPTGAAILAALAPDYTEQPALTLERVGHGIGSRDYPGWPNVLRLLIGTADSPNDPEVDRVVQLETNLDDVPAELIGYCIEQLWSAGALDVYTVPIQMKKGRPGVMLGVLAGIEEADACARLMFRETGTFGIRRQTIERWKLQRRMIEVQTPWGPVRAKQGWRDGIRIVSPEYEDCARIARDHGIPLRDVYAFVQSRADQPEA